MTSLSDLPPLQIMYDPLEGTIVPDGKASDWVDATINQWIADGKPLRQITVGGSLLIDHFRVRVVRKIIDHAEIMFRFKHWGIYVSEGGRCSDWPRGFCDYVEDALYEILDKGEM